MLSKTFETKEGAQAAGYTFVPAKVIEYVFQNGRKIGHIQRVDVSGGSSFGYDFQIGAYTAGRWNVGKFGSMAELWIKQARNKGGKMGAVFTNAMLTTDYESALNAARQAVIDNHNKAVDNSDY